ncbi:MAG: hypothetical protein MUE90_13995 [Thermoanaerobaculales bacterium]|nr:hypothetical protein [Thermoanaerobaculales bacterium]
MSIRNLVLIVVAAAWAAVGCSGEPAAEKTPAAEQGSAAAASHSEPAAGAQLVSGSVVETMDAAGYTYVRVDTGSGEIWAASGQFPVAVGDRVTLPLETPMQNFHSASLERDFELIYFASFIVPEGQAPALPATASEAELPPGHPSLDAFAVADSSATGQSAAVAAPAGGVAIADIWQRRDALAGTQVTVRGRVVKYNGGILGRNWLHLQDGSGELAKGTNDLTVTTTDAAAIGDVVTATGTVAVNRDFGAGYTYTVMVEDATLSR